YSKPMGAWSIMRRSARTIVAIAGICTLIVLSGVAYASGFELSFQHQDRRNQIGSMTNRWTASTWHDLGGWEFRATFGLDQRGTNLLDYERLPPVSVRKDGQFSRIAVGVDRLP